MHSWDCRADGSYRRGAINAVDFASDGSLFAVPFGPTVTVWETHMHRMRAALSAPQSDAVRDIGFIPQSTCLASATSTNLSVWDLKSCSVIWSWTVHVSSLTVHPTNNLFAIATHDGDVANSTLLTFSSESESPSHVVQLLHTPVQAVAFVGDDTDAATPSLVVQTTSRSLIPIFHGATSKPSPSAPSAPPSALDGLILPTTTTTSTDADGDKAVHHGVKTPLGVLTAPPHTLPPPSKLVADLMTEVLAAAPTTTTTTTTTSEQDRARTTEVVVGDEAEPMDVVPQPTDEWGDEVSVDLALLTAVWSVKDDDEASPPKSRKPARSKSKRAK